MEKQPEILEINVCETFEVVTPSSPEYVEVPIILHGYIQEIEIVSSPFYITSTPTNGPNRWFTAASVSSAFSG